MLLLFKFDITVAQGTTAGGRGKPGPIQENRYVTPEQKSVAVTTVYTATGNKQGVKETLLAMALASQ